MIYVFMALHAISYLKFKKIHKTNLIRTLVKTMDAINTTNQTGFPKNSSSKSITNINNLQTTELMASRQKLFTEDENENEVTRLYLFEDAILLQIAS